MGRITLDDYYKLTNDNRVELYPEMSTRDNLENRLRDIREVERLNNMLNPVSRPDYGHLSLRDNLQAHADDLRRKQQQENNISGQAYAQNNNSTPPQFPAATSWGESMPDNQSPMWNNNPALTGNRQTSWNNNRMMTDNQQPAFMPQTGTTPGFNAAQMPVEQPSANNQPSYNEPTLMETLENMANGIYQGATGGYIDEFRGLQHGLVYGLGDWITGRGDGTFSGGFERGYKQKRDEYRQAYKKAEAQNPKLTDLAELNGILALSGIHRVVNKVFPWTKTFTEPVSKSLPLAKQRAIQLRNAAVLGGFYGLGGSEGDWKNQLTDTAAGIGSGILAHKALQGIARRIHVSSDLYSDNLVPVFVDPITAYFTSKGLSNLTSE